MRKLFFSAILELLELKQKITLFFEKPHSHNITIQCSIHVFISIYLYLNAILIIHNFSIFRHVSINIDLTSKQFSFCETVLNLMFLQMFLVYVFLVSCLLDYLVLFRVSYAKKVLKIWVFLTSFMDKIQNCHSTNLLFLCLLKTLVIICQKYESHFTELKILSISFCHPQN